MHIFIKYRHKKHLNIVIKINPTRFDNQNEIKIQHLRPIGLNSVSRKNSLLVKFFLNSPVSRVIPAYEGVKNLTQNGNYAIIRVLIAVLKHFERRQNDGKENHRQVYSHTQKS